MDLPMPAPVTDWVPVKSCTLPTREQPLRGAEFDSLFATSLRAVEQPRPSRSQARLVLAGDETLAARVRRLADAETSCCSFFTFTLTPLDVDATDATERTVIALDIEVPAARSEVLAALVHRARRAAS
jgi:hypothetical protein